MLKFDKKNLIGTDGSGNQKKFWLGNTLYKIDSKYRDSTKEVSACNIAEAFGIPHVIYNRAKVLVDGEEKWCCFCKSYLSSEDMSISIDKLLTSGGINNISWDMSVIDYFNLTCNIIYKYSGLALTYIQWRLLEILTFDFIIANDDRHLNNLDVISFADGRYDIAPIYDNGHSFFRRDTVLSYEEIERLSRKFKTKPFSPNQWKNLINLDYSKSIAKRFKKTVENKYGSLKNISGVLEGHSKIMRYRLEKLLSKGV